MHRVTVLRNDPAGTQLRLIELDRVPPDHHRAGQFVTVSEGGSPAAFFALASSPGEPALLLVKDEGETAGRVAASAPGSTIEMSDVIGQGFALERVAGRELVILCNGSGISAVRPVVRQELARGLRRPVHLLYGVLTPDRRSFPWDLEDWANAGVKVHTIVGAPEATGWRGATGYVQDVARSRGLVRDDVGVVLVGVPAMLEQARALFRAAGCPDEHLLVNF